MGRGARLIQQFLRSRTLPVLSPNRSHRVGWLESTEPRDSKLSRTHRVYVEGEGAWFIPDWDETLFVVRCYIIDISRLDGQPVYFLDEPVPDPVAALELYPELQTAIDALERKRNFLVARATAASFDYTPGVVIPDVDVILREERIDVPSIDLSGWRKRLLALFGDALDLTEEDLFPKILGVDWFHAENFVAPRQGDETA